MSAQIKKNFYIVSSLVFSSTGSVNRGALLATWGVHVCVAAVPPLSANQARSGGIILGSKERPVESDFGNPVDNGSGRMLDRWWGALSLLP